MNNQTTTTTEGTQYIYFAHTSEAEQMNGQAEQPTEQPTDETSNHEENPTEETLLEGVVSRLFELLAYYKCENERLSSLVLSYKDMLDKMQERMNKSNEQFARLCDCIATQDKRISQLRDER